MTDQQLVRQQEAWRKLALVKEELSKGVSVRQALTNAHMSAGSYYKQRGMAPPGQEQPVATPARKALPAPAKTQASPLNYCPHCGMNLRAVNIALNMNHE